MGGRSVLQSYVTQHIIIENKLGLSWTNPKLSYSLTEKHLEQEELTIRKFYCSWN